MLEEITTQILGSEPDFEIVATIRAPLGVPRKITRAGADVALLGSNDAALASELVEACPGLAVIAVAEEGQSAWLYTAEREPVALGALSPAALVRTVRELGRAEADGDRLDR
jgi:hypothetical protein